MYKFFSQHENVVAGMSTRDNGNMKLKGERSTDDAMKNRKKFCEQNGIKYEDVVSACVEHTTNVAVVDSSDNQYLTKTDALVTRHKDIYLTVTSADCFPVLMYDNKNDVIGIAHAGWKGIVNEVVPKTLDAMVSEGAKMENIKLIIGPGISQDYFDFEFADLIKYFGFYNQDKYVVDGSTIDKVKVNLREIIFDQVKKTGVNKENIHDCGQCTFAHKNDFFSARRDGKDFSVMLSIFGMKTA